ncbi:prepilin-type N-terminal cleavage/methylation domain-containing protein [Rubritalea sp.]|uniref:prepilin-type N-terminal cleavage/methylation domain-containing protein n=1 Tax=Rubritalea sp. TaxID=2109375 RepID=UPI003EF0CFD9
MKKNTFALKGQKGVTLIELSVVIAVILVLISVLFIGASYYKTSANSAACTVNRSSIQKGADSYMNISGLSTTSVTDAGLLAGPFSAGLPVCPTGGAGTYTITAANGSSSVTCTSH